MRRLSNCVPSLVLYLARCVIISRCLVAECVVNRYVAGGDTTSRYVVNQGNFRKLSYLVDDFKGIPNIPGMPREANELGITFKPTKFDIMHFRNQGITGRDAVGKK